MKVVFITARSPLHAAVRSPPMQDTLLSSPVAYLAWVRHSIRTYIIRLRAAWFVGRQCYGEKQLCFRLRDWAYKGKLGAALAQVLQRTSLTSVGGPGY